jgi:hypothetical protein
MQVPVQPGAPAQTIVVVQQNSAPPIEVQCCCCIPMSMGYWFVGIWCVLMGHVLYIAVVLGTVLTKNKVPEYGVPLIIVCGLAFVVTLSFFVFCFMGISKGLDTAEGRRLLRKGIMMMQLGYGI